MRQDVVTEPGAPAHQQTPTTLRMRIAETGIRQYLVADRLGISDGHLSKILTGRKTVDAELLARIGHAVEDVAAGRDNRPAVAL